MIKKIKPSSVWDLGANTGVYSRIPAKMGIDTISFDIDPAAVEKNYRNCIAHNEKNILPLLLDLTNPSPGIGWTNSERMSFNERGPVDLIMALALIHHLAIGNNIPLGRIALFFSYLCKNLIIEFVPKNDSQVRRLLASREDIFNDYSLEKFEEAFINHFRIIKKFQVEESERYIYYMSKA